MRDWLSPSRLVRRKLSALVPAFELPVALVVPPPVGVPFARRGPLPVKNVEVRPSRTPEVEAGLKYGLFEGVQHLDAELERGAALEPDALDGTQVEPHEPRTVDHERTKATVAVGGRGFDTVEPVRRHQVPALRRAERAVAVGRSRADGERSNGVLDDVVGQDVELAVGGHAEIDRLTEFIHRHADESDVAEVQLLAGLDAADAVDFPSAEQALLQPARIARERQLVDEVALHGVLDVADLFDPDFVTNLICTPP